MQVLRCTRKMLDSNWVEAEVNRLSQLLSGLNPETIYLIGSAAENEMTDQSDFDFVLVFSSDATLRTAQKRLLPSYPLSEFPVDLVWVTRETFEAKKEMGGICFVAHREGRATFQKKAIA